MITLDLSRESSNESKHARLRDYFVGEMLSGRLRPGQALPSEREMMRLLGVARTTIRQATDALVNDGLIRRIHGKGMFVEDDVRQRLKRGQDVFALVVPETRSGFYPSLLHGFETAAAELRHRTMICSTNSDVNLQSDIILQLLDEKVGGIALNPTTPSPTPAYHVRQIQERGVPVVFCHSRVEGVAAPLLALPFSEIGRKAGRLLLEHGHRHVAIVGTDLSSPHRGQPFLTGFHEAFLPEDDGSLETVLIRDWDDEDPARAALQRLLSQPQPPTAIYTTFDSLAETVYIILQGLGVRVPEDISLLSFGGAWRDGPILRRVTSIVVDENDTGRRAVGLLDEMRRGERPIDNNEGFVLEVSLYSGETLRRSTS